MSFQIQVNSSSFTCLRKPPIPPPKYPLLLHTHSPHLELTPPFQIPMGSIMSVQCPGQSDLISLHKFLPGAGTRVLPTSQIHKAVPHPFDLSSMVTVQHCRSHIEGDALHKERKVSPDLGLCFIAHSERKELQETYSKTMGFYFKGLREGFLFKILF